SGDGNGNGGGYYNREAAQARANGIMTGQAAGYSVASGHDYLGYPKGEQPFGGGGVEGGGSGSGNGGGGGEGLWDEGVEVEDEERGQRRVGGGGGGMW
ncbi:hypothetical protein KC324_g18065, partial [Hortaea werneckii]